jgi:hypothetical protein
VERKIRDREILARYSAQPQIFYRVRRANFADMRVVDILRMTYKVSYIFLNMVPNIVSII